MWKFIKDYFTFSRTEIRVILIVSVLLMLTLVFRLSLKFLPHPINNVSDEEIRKVEEFITSLELKDEEIKKEVKPKAEARYEHLKVFDPNLVTDGELKIMGFPDNVISNISKFRRSGGRFFKKEEFRKIYGVSDSAFTKIAPYINIIDLNPKAKILRNTNIGIPKVIKIINLNTADSAQLVRLKGIGPGFALRIIKYRTRLGGFIFPEQLLEVFGMDSSRFDLFKESVFVDTTGLRKIDLNKVTFSVLARHPYMDNQTAASILKFRDFRGTIKDIRELNSYNIIQKDKLKKIEPYLLTSHN